MKISARISALLIASVISADQMTHKFNSPSFSGINTSSHYLTKENQEHTRKQDIKDQAKALAEDLEREAKNSTTARFLRNLESRIFAQISRQITDSIFGPTAQTSGVIDLLGNRIEYEVIGQFIKLTITDENGTRTEITVPLDSFTF